MISKDELRREMRKKKRMMQPEEIKTKSSKILDALQQMPQWNTKEVLYLYVSYNQEVQTGEIMEQWLREGKRLAAPKVTGPEIKFYFVESREQLQPGYQGILEPVTEDCADGREGWMLLPGLAFDENMHRMGYGGGFYDRYLNKWNDTDIYKVALAYEFQVVSQIPTEPHDCLMDAIVTECAIR